MTLRLVSDNVVALDTVNVTDVPDTIRTIADEIDKGSFGEVCRAILIIVDEMGEPITVGCGVECNRVATLGTLEYAKHRFLQSLDEDDEGYGG